MFYSKEYNNMETKIDIAEILKEKPQGTKLYDLLRNIDVELDKVHITDVGNYIECISTNEVGSTLKFDYSKLGTEGGWLDGLQILLPSKGMRDWRKFAWNTGDILVSKDGNAHVIFKGFDDDTYETFNGNNYLWKNEGITMCFGEYEDELSTSDFGKANKEDAQKYIHKIEKRLGGKLNIETLEIEKQTEFKDGDVIVTDAVPSLCYSKCIFILKGDLNTVESCANSYIFYNIDNNDFCFDVLDTEIRDRNIHLATEEEKKQLFSALEKEGKAWDGEKKEVIELKPEVELKPFDKVLVRNSSIRKWEVDLFGYKSDAGLYHCVGYTCNQCIPYEGNEHLLGTTNAPK